MLLPLATRRLYYDLAGPEDGAVVCITHSLASDGGSWAEQVPALLEAGFRVLRLDMRGHGGSDPVAGDYTMQQLAGDVVAVLDALGLARVHYIGLSIGGMIGQAFALEHGDRLISAMWCDTLPASPPGAAEIWGPRIKAVREANSLAPIAEASMDRYLSPAFQAKNPGRWKQLRDTVRRHHARRLSRLLGGDPRFRFRGPAAVACGCRCWWSAASTTPAPRPAKTAASPASSPAPATRRSPACAISPTSKPPPPSTASCSAGSTRSVRRGDAS